MKTLTEWANARAEAVARDVAAGIDVPGVIATAEGADVVLEGRGLRRRMLSDVRLRAIGQRARARR